MLREVTLEDTLEDIRQWVESLNNYGEKRLLQYSPFVLDDMKSDEHFIAIQAINDFMCVLLEFKFNITHLPNNKHLYKYGNMPISMLNHIDDIISTLNIHRDSVIRKHARNSEKEFQNYKNNIQEVIINNNDDRS